MINNFTVENFKCYDNFNLKFNNLVVISGTNNSGKSSLLEAIYLLTQNKTHNKGYVYLNTTQFLNLGSFKELLNNNISLKEAIKIILDINCTNLDFEYLSIEFSYKSSADFEINSTEDNPVLEKIRILYEDKHNFEDEIFIELKSENNMLIYKISSKNENGFCKLNGIIPESVIYKDSLLSHKELCSQYFDKIINVLRNFNETKIKYIRALRLYDYDHKTNLKNNIYGQYNNQEIHNIYNNNHEYFKGYTFRTLLDKYIKYFFGNNYETAFDENDRKDKIFIIDKSIGYKYSLKQLGFGISQLLPIMILLLTSEENDIIIIENPEIHLHPKLQSIFIDLVLFVIQNNRKIIIETHSEHIINRIRLNIKKGETNSNFINIIFLKKEEQIIKESIIDIDKEGKITNWPEDFFDQNYKDVLELIKHE